MRFLTIIPELINMGIPQVENIIDQLPKHPTKVYPPRPIEQVDTFVFHHAASEAPLINQANYHVNVRGWAALGYAIVIWGNRILQCNPLDVQTNHTKGYNHRAIGIAVLADLSKRSLTERERELIVAAFVSLNAVLPGRVIKGHNECGVATSCPATSMNQIRQDIASLEEQIQFLQSGSNQNKEIYESVIRLNDLYDKFLNKEGKYSKEIQQEALRKLTNLHSVLKEKQYI